MTLSRVILTVLAASVVLVGGCEPKTTISKSAPKVTASDVESPPATPQAPAYDYLTTPLNVVKDAGKAQAAIAASEALMEIDSTADPKAFADAVTRARSLADDGFEKPAPIFAAFHNHLGTAAYYAGDMQTAKDEFEKALAGFKDAKHFPSVDVLEVLANLSAISNVFGEFDKSEIYLNQERDLITEMVGPENPQMAKNFYNRGYLEFRLGNYEKSLAAMETAVDMNARTHDPDSHDDVMSYIGQVSSISALYDRLGYPKKAILSNERAADLVSKTLPNTHPLSLQVMSNYGGTLANQGRYSEAATILEKVVTARRAAHGETNTYTANSMHSLAYALGESGNTDGAETLFLKARDIFLGQDSNEKIRAAVSLTMAAEMAERQGKYNIAKSRWVVANTEMKAFDKADHAERVQVLLSLAKNSLKINNQTEAKTYSAAALALSTEKLSPDSPYHLQAILYSALSGTEVDAKSAFDTALAQVKLDMLDPKFTSENLAPYLPVFERYSEYSLNQNDIDGALSAFQYANFNRASEAVTARENRLGEGEHSNDIRALQDQRQAFLALDAAYIEALNAGDGSAAKVARDEAYAKLKFAIASIPSDRVFGASFETLTTSEIQDTLKPDEALLIIDLSEVQPHLIIISQTQSFGFRTPADRYALRRASQTLRSAIDSRADIVDVKSAGHDLHDKLFSALSLQVLDEVSHLKIVSNDVLQSLPLGVIWDGDTWLADHYSMTVMPGLMGSTPPSASTKGVKFLGVGDPKLGAPKAVQTAAFTGSANMFYRGGEAALEALESLPPLPQTKAELESMRKTFGRRNSRLVTGAAMEESTIRSLPLADYNVITFATHALTSGEFSGLSEPALVMSLPEDRSAVSSDNDGLLTQSEIETLKLAADFVILSACNTAAGDSLGAQGLTGLTSAFLYAGTDSLLVSHWPVRDDAAAFLTTNTVEKTRKGMPKAKALQLAMQELRRSNLKDAEHPAIWGPFILVGQN